MNRVFRWLRQTSEPPPGVVYVELVNLLFGSLAPVVAIGIVLVFAGAIFASRDGDFVFYAVAIAGALVTGVRVRVILGYRRRLARSRPSVAEAKVWALRFALGTFAISVLVGVLDLRALSLQDPVMPMLVSAMIFSYGAALVARVQSSPSICITSLMLAVVPTAIGFGMNLAGATNRGNVVAFSAQMALIAGYVMASLQAVLAGYRATLQLLVAKKDLAVLASQDALTGLANRMQLQTRFSDGVLEVAESDDLIAFLCLDLDKFKAVNDAFGHPTGDALLKAVAARLSGTLKAGDTAARIGGDEFVVLQIGIRRAEEALVLAQRIIRVLSAPYHFGDQEVRVGASIGIALFPRDGIELEKIHSCADAALYRAKCGNHIGPVFWNPMPTPPPIASAANSMAAQS